MMKKTLLVTLLIFSGLAQAEIKSAFINPSAILEQAPQAKSASKVLADEFKGRENALKELAKKIQDAEKRYQTDSAIMTSELKKKAEDEIIQDKRKFQFDQQSMREDVQKRRRQLIQELQTSISVVIKQYGKDNGYDFIFTEGVAYASDKVDITDEILKLLQK